MKFVDTTPLLLVVLLFWAGLPAQEKKGVQIKVESRLVLVDLVVTDNMGRFVEDLKAGEVRIFEDNKPRQISFFEKSRPGSGRNPAQTAGRAGTELKAPAGARAAPPEVERGVTLVFMIDRPSISPGQLIQVKRTITDFVRSKTGPGDTLMLAATGQGAQPYQSPTGDVETFLRALDRVSATEDPSSLPRFGEDLENLIRTAQDTALPLDWLTRNAIDLAREYMKHEEEIARSSYDAAAAQVKDIGTLPGRKNVLYFSGGYRLRIGPAVQDALLQGLKESPISERGSRAGPGGGAGAAPVPGSDSSSLQIRSLLGAMTNMEKLDSYLRMLVDEANRSQVSFYAVDARALMTGSDIRFRARREYSEQLMREEIGQPQAFLRSLAEGTGGRWFLNSNELGTAIGSAHADLAQHYELGYAPDGRGAPGTLHKITVKVLRPDVQVSHRQGFVEPGEFDAERRTVENAFKFTELFQDFPIEADISFRNRKLRVDVFIPARFLGFGRSEDRYRCDLTVYMALFDAGGKLYGNKIWFSKTYKLDYSEAERLRLDKVDNLTSSCRGEVPPGSYRLKVVVRQSPASRTAALEKRVEVTSAESGFGAKAPAASSSPRN